MICCHVMTWTINVFLFKGGLLFSDCIRVALHELELKIILVYLILCRTSVHPIQPVRVWSKPFFWLAVPRKKKLWLSLPYKDRHSHWGATRGKPIWSTHTLTSLWALITGTIKFKPSVSEVRGDWANCFELTGRSDSNWNIHPLQPKRAEERLWTEHTSNLEKDELQQQKTTSGHSCHLRTGNWGIGGSGCCCWCNASGYFLGSNV